MTSIRTRLLAVLILAGVLSASQAATADVVYPNFSDISKLRLNGSATTVGDDLRLVDTGEQAGSAFTRQPVVDTTKSFKSNFKLSMHDSVFPGDGMAFVITSEPATSLGGIGGQLGYGGIDNSVAVEFDIYDNGGEPGNNHIAIVKNGMSTKDGNATDPPFAMFDGPPFRVWVDFKKSENRLSVYASQENAKPEAPVVTARVGLSGLTADRARAGFTAGTGGASIEGDVLNWRLVQ